MKPSDVIVLVSPRELDPSEPAVCDILSPPDFDDTLRAFRLDSSDAESNFDGVNELDDFDDDLGGRAA